MAPLDERGSIRSIQFTVLRAGPTRIRRPDPHVTESETALPPVRPHRPASRPRASRAAAALLALASLPGPAAAQDVPFGGQAAEAGAPVEVTADSLSIDQAAGTAVFEGGVVVGQGALRLAAERVEVEYAEGTRRIVRLTATGAVTLVSGEDAAEAREAVYDVDGGEIVLSGDVLLTQGSAGGAALSSERLRLDLATGEAQLDGRVRTVLPQAD